MKIISGCFVRIYMVFLTDYFLHKSKLRQRRAGDRVAFLVYYPRLCFCKRAREGPWWVRSRGLTAGWRQKNPCREFIERRVKEREKGKSNAEEEEEETGTSLSLQKSSWERESERARESRNGRSLSLNRTLVPA